jgi:hypothetical protein
MIRVFRRRVALVVIALSTAAGCAAEPVLPEPSRPATVAELDPCALVSPPARVQLGLGVGVPEKKGHRRSCRYVVERTAVLGTENDGISLLDVVIRESGSQNTVADARRLADTVRRDRGATLTTLDLDGRVVYRTHWEVASSTQLGACSLLYTVGPTSSVQVDVLLDGDSPECGLGDLATGLARSLPVPDNQEPARTDRPVDLRAVDPCALVTADRLRAFGLKSGRPKDGRGGCSFSSDATQAGQVTFVSATIWGVGAEASSSLGGKLAVRLDVGGRSVFEVREPGDTVSMCDYWFEVTRATSVWLAVWVNGTEVEPACGVGRELAPTVEPLLPPVAV